MKRYPYQRRGGKTEKVQKKKDGLDSEKAVIRDCLEMSPEELDASLDAVFGPEPRTRIGFTNW